MKLVAVIVLVVYLKLLAYGADAVIETDSYLPTHLQSGVSTLTVDSKVEGTINWHSNSGDRVTFNVTKTAYELASDTYDFSGISITLINPSNNIVILEVGNTQSCKEADAANHTVLAQWILIFACSLLPWLAFFRSHIHFLLLLISLLLCITAFSVNATDECVEIRVDVDIHVPRNFTFGAIDLKTMLGSIEVDEEFVALTTPRSCFSGLDKQECPRCCSGHGRCINGECLCNVGYRNGTQDCENKTEITFRLHTNPADPVILEGATPDGDIVSLIGTKDENGTVLTVDQFQVLDLEGNTTYIFLEEGAPSTAMDSSGASVSFEWSEDFTSVVITATSPNGSFELIKHINLTETSTDEENLFTKRQTTPKRSGHSKEHWNIHTEYKKPTLKTHEKARRQAGSSTGAAIVTVTVYSCGAPEENSIVGAIAYRDYKTSTAEYSKEDHYIGVKTSETGVFHINLPTISASTVGQDIGDVCENINDKLSEVCSRYEQVKKITRIRPELILCPALVHPAAIRLCFTVFKGLKWYCDKIDTPIIPIDGHGIFQVPSRGEVICDLVTEFLDKGIDIFRDESILLTPYALFPLGHMVTAEGQVITLTPGLTGLLPNMFTIVNGQIEPQIVSLTVFPIDPAPGQDYVTTVTYICATINTVTYMSIIGTDDYFDEVYCFGVSGNCVLFVPGAAALVQDTIQVSISNPITGYFTARTTYIIF